MRRTPARPGELHGLTGAPNDDRILRDVLLRLDLAGLAAADVGPRSAWIGPQCRRPEKPRIRSFESIDVTPTDVGRTSIGLLWPDDRVQTN